METESPAPARDGKRGRNLYGRNLRPRNLRQTLSTSLIGALPQAALALGVFLGLLAIAHAFAIPEPWRETLTWAAGITALMEIALWRVLHRRPPPPRTAHPVAAFVIIPAHLNVLAQLYLTREPLGGLNLLILNLGLGFLPMLTSWWIGLIGISLVGWLVAAIIAPSDPAPGRIGISMVLSVGGSYLVHRIQLRAHRRLDQMGRREIQREVALAEARHTSAEVQRALDVSVDVAERLASVADLTPLLDEICSLIRVRYGYRQVAILRWTSAATLETIAGAGPDGNASSPGRRTISLDPNGPYSKAVSGQRPVTLEGGEEGRTDGVVRLLIPLVAAAEVHGILEVEALGVEGFNKDRREVLQSLAKQISTAVYSTGRYEMERKQRQFAEKLTSVGRVLLRTLDPEEVLHMVLSQLAEVVPYDRGAIMLAEEDALIVRAARGFPIAASPLEIRVPIQKEDVYYTIYTTQRPLAIPDVTQRADWQYVENLPTARSWLGVPLILEGEVIGMLSLTRERREPYGDEEITLTAAFAHQAAVALNNARLYNDLADVNRELERTVAELQERTEDLQVTYRQLERLDQAKSDFINVAAHELRTPLTVLSGYSQMLMKDPEISGNAYREALIEGIQTGTQRLSTIVEDMVDMARIDNRALQLHPEPIFPAVLLKAISSTLDDLRADRDVELILDESLQSLPMIEADTEGLRKVFYHLMVNAIKYTPDGGSVRVWGRELSEDALEGLRGGVEIIVSDTGIGIDPRYQDLIFAKFYQTGRVAVHSSGADKFKGGGPGLGLAIARGVVEAHGGRIWVESPGHDEESYPGSQFHVLLPRRAAAILGDRPVG